MDFNFMSNGDGEDPQINLEMSDMENEISKEEKKEFYSKVKILKGRLEEYQKAFKYFKDNDMFRRQEDAEKIVKQINLIKEPLKKIKESKNWKEADISNLPKEITPEFIYGCTYQQRDNEFNKLIAYKKERLKNLDKKIIKLEKYPTMRTKLEETKQKKNLIEQQIQIYQQKFKNRWCPPPMYTETIGQNGKIKLDNISVPRPFKIDEISNNNNNNINENYGINENVLNTDIPEEELNNEKINEEFEENEIKEDKDDYSSDDAINKKKDDSKKSDCNILNDNEKYINNEQINYNSNKNNIEISNNKSNNYPENDINKNEDKMMDKLNNNVNNINNNLIMNNINDINKQNNINRIIK